MSWEQTICKNCKYHRYHEKGMPYIYHHCLKYPMIDPVTGETEYADCYQRNTGYCSTYEYISKEDKDKLIAEELSKDMDNMVKHLKELKNEKEKQEENKE